MTIKRTPKRLAFLIAFFVVIGLLPGTVASAQDPSTPAAQTVTATNTGVYCFIYSGPTTPVANFVTLFTSGVTAVNQMTLPDGSYHSWFQLAPGLATITVLNNGDMICVAAPAGTAVFMSSAIPAGTSVIDGIDYGPLVGLIGTWKSAPSGGVDVAPGQSGSPVGQGGPAVSPYYETITYTPAGGVVNASEQHLAALYYRQQVFAKSDHKQFHDQTGYLIYDKKNQKVYDTFCIPRGVCVVAEGAPGTKMTLKTQSKGVAETQYMLKTDRTQAFSVTFTLSGNTLKYTQKTDLQVYGKPFSHTDSDTLKRRKTQ